MSTNWTEVPGYEGKLEAHPDGKIRTMPSIRVGIRSGKPHSQRKKGVELSPFLGRNGYLHIAPKFGPDRKKLLVHRLVALTFVPGHFDGASVNHIDGDRLNNKATNLEWLTLADNTRHQWRIGLVNIRGERHPSAKLKDYQRREIVGTRRHESPTLLAAEYGVSTSAIYKLREGKKRAWGL